jgi:hypothetical protein
MCVCARSEAQGIHARVVEGPVPEHLKERVVVHVLANVVEVVVLAASTDALLRVDGRRQLVQRSVRIGSAWRTVRCIRTSAVDTRHDIRDGTAQEQHKNNDKKYDTVRVL